MSGFDVGLTGLNAAQKAIDVIGNNIANAATEGYHRQTVDLTPSYARLDNGVLVGGGVEVSGTTRAIDVFLEAEILRQQSSLSQVSQESTTLSSVEAAFGELTGNTGLNAAIDQFFNSLNNLSAHPDQGVYQNDVLASADTMAGQFRTLGDFLSNLQTQIGLQAENVAGQINTLAGQIANFNDDIQRIEISGGQPGNLLDQRDQLIKQVSELAGIQAQQVDYGAINVDIGGVPIVMGSAAMQVEVGLNEDGLLGITPAGASTYQTTVDGGQLGGLMALYNNTIGGIHSDLDTLALSIIQQVNQYHVQGVGSDGSFTELTGKAMLSEDISDFVPPVSAGSFFIRVTHTDPTTHEVTVIRHEIYVDPSNPLEDSLSDIATEISNQIPPQLHAFVSDNKLCIQADNDCKFDFLPAVLSEPTETNFTADPPSSRPAVSVSGIYTGSENQTFAFKVIGGDPVDGGSVGNGTLQLEVRDGDNNLIDTLNIGSGYAAGDQLDFGNGIKIAVGAGKVYNDDNFKVAAYANTDTSGLLSAIGINTFFAGNNASNMSLAGDIADAPGRIATALGSGLTDNANARRLASVGETEISGLNSLTAGQFYRQLVSDIGQQLSVKQMSQSNTETLVHGLTTQQSGISGVDTNDEAAQMMVFEQMFQAMAKYLTTVNATLASIMNIL